MTTNLIKKFVPSRILPLTYLTERTIRKARGVIQSGPFKGIKYIEKAYCSSICPKLAGTYEKEIRDTISELLKQNFDSFIDIGSAEGYYSIGFAKYGNCKKVISFECSAEARKMQTQLAELNGVNDRIEIHGQCEHEELRTALKNHNNNLILCDIEGYEHALLDTGMIPKLASATMMIECHNHVWEQMETSLEKRFCKTHRVTSFKAQLHGNPSDYPFPNLYYWILPRKYKSFPIQDQRAPETSWLYLEPFN